MNKKIKYINTKKAPQAMGPYSQGVIFKDLIFCSGQIGINPKTGQLERGIANQTKRALENLKEILIAAHSSLKNVLKVTIYLKNISDFQIVNKIYEDFFKNHKPARATIEISDLPKNALIEIEAISLKNK